jgi:hypothetical protein
MPAIVGAPFAITIAWTDPDAVQSPPGRSGSSLGVELPHQITGSDRSSASAGFHDQPATATSGGVGELPVQAQASSAGMRRDTWMGRAGIRIPEA